MKEAEGYVHPGYVVAKSISKGYYISRIFLFANRLGRDLKLLTTAGKIRAELQEAFMNRTPC